MQDEPEGALLQVFTDVAINHVWWSLPESKIPEIIFFHHARSLPESHGKK
jgi:hypothetical protein